MNAAFHDRSHAGELLASWLRPLAGRLDVVVLALPRGGVPVAHEVANKLCAPLDVMIVRKIGVPGQEELAMGAIASGGIIVRNEDVLASTAVGAAEFDRHVARERAELQRREGIYRGDRPPLELEGKTVILVDDGIATGATMRAAVEAAHRRQAAAVIVATPVASSDAIENLRSGADEIITIMVPETLFAVGEFYQNFQQTTDDEVIGLLAEHVPAGVPAGHGQENPS